MLIDNLAVIPLQFKYSCCATCDLRPACPAKHASHIRRSSSVADYKFPLTRRDHLFRQGEKVKALYVLRTGSMKNYISIPHGTDHVVRFHLPGDVIALDAIGDQAHSSSVQALEDVSLCQIPASCIEDGCDVDLKLSMHLLRLTSTQVVREQRRGLILSHRDAAERVALFLLQLSTRYRKHGLPECEFELNMSRGEIASYLALTIETVSRACTQFQSMGLIKFDHRRIHLLSLHHLKKMAKVEHLWLVQ